MATRGLPLWPWTDAEADTLPPAERLLLEAARLWAQETRRGLAGAPALRRLLATESAEVAASALDALLRGLTAPHPVAIGCPLCPRLVGHEPALLLAVALAQRGPRREALALLLCRLPGRDGYAATAAAVALGHAFRNVGLNFADPWQRAA